MNWRARADRLRALPMPVVLAALDATPDPGDPAKWRTARGVLSVTGAKFINWNQGDGGGGDTVVMVDPKTGQPTTSLLASSTENQAMPKIETGID